MATRTIAVTPKRKGVRAEAKQASRDKIVMAARKLFAERGYDDATLRQIARSAGLGLATLFNHISDKRDLIYLIFDEDMESVNERALAAPRPWQSFQEKILTVTEPYFRLFGGDPVLSRILLSEVLQQTPGLHLERHLHIRGQLIEGFRELAEEAQKTGELRDDISPEVAAHCIFVAFSGGSRWWISQPTPDWRSGQQQFANVIKIITEGLRNRGGRAAGKQARGVAKAHPAKRVVSRRRRKGMSLPREVT